MPTKIRAEHDEARHDVRWHARLAALLAASGKLSSAAAHYERALGGLQQLPGDEQQQQRSVPTQRERLQWQFELAAVRARLRDHNAAIALYEEILRVRPTFAEALVNLAAQLAIADTARLENALELCVRALELHPDFAEAHYNRNMLLRRLGRQREATSLYWGFLAHDLGSDVLQRDLPVRLPQDLDAGGVDSQSLSVQHSMVPAGFTDPEATSAIDKLQSADGVSGVAVICVKWGTKYDAQYVNKLYNAVMRHAGKQMQPHLTFLCLTDESEGIQVHTNTHILQLEAGWKGWWNKCQLFSTAVSDKLHALGHSRCVYMDLDTVIVGDLSDLLAWTPPPGALALLKTDHMTNERRQGGFNSSLMLWRSAVVDEFSGSRSLGYLHDFLHAHLTTVSKYIYKFDHWLEMALPDALFLEDVLPEQVVEYRSLDEAASKLPANARVVCFPLSPKPHDAKAAWVAQHWV